jgi:hypothetical protein
MAENKFSKVMDDWPIFLDYIDWIVPTLSSGVTLSANSFELSSAAISHWPNAIQGKLGSLI